MNLPESLTSMLTDRTWLPTNGVTQTCGRLVVVSRRTGVLMHVASGDACPLGDGARFIGKKITGLCDSLNLPDYARDGISAALSERRLLSSSPIEYAEDANATHFLTYAGDHILLESRLRTNEFQVTTHLVNDTLERFPYDLAVGGLEVRAIAETLCNAVSAISGFHRIFAYHFDPSGAGRVIAEHAAGPLPSLLGAEGPTGIYESSRIFSDSRGLTIPCVNMNRWSLTPEPNQGAGNAIDLTRAVLRAPTSAYIENLRQSGIGAALMRPIYVNRRLWGMLCCHHASARLSPSHVNGAITSLMRRVETRISALDENAPHGLDL